MTQLHLMTATALDLQVLHALCGGNLDQHNYLLVSRDGHLSVTPVRPDEESILNGAVALYSICLPVLWGDEDEYEDGEGVVSMSLADAEDHLQALQRYWEQGEAGYIG